MEFRFRISDLELRSCDSCLRLDRKHTTAEIIKWNEMGTPSEYCYVLAYWNQNDEGYDLQFVGKRPFEVNQSNFMKLAEQGQRILEFEFYNNE